VCVAWVFLNIAVTEATMQAVRLGFIVASALVVGVAVIKLASLMFS
jgi:hypothetical protein